MSKELDSSIQALYQTFQRYPLRSKINGCPCCNLEASEARLHKVLLPKLNWDDFHVYPFKAMTTFGDVEDFKHFLPRILELLTLDEMPHYDVGLILSKLGYARLKAWPSDERDAVAGFLLAFWRWSLATSAEHFHNGMTIEDLVHGIANTELSVEPFLTIWSDLSNDQHAMHLADFISYHIQALMRRKTLEGFDAANGARLLAWLKDPALAEGMQKAFDRTVDEERKECLSYAYKGLTNWQERP